MYHRFDVSTPRLWLLIQEIQCMQGIQQAHKQEWHSLHDVDANTANISMLAGPSMEQHHLCTKWRLTVQTTCNAQEL